MRVPVFLKVFPLAVALTAFYTWYAHLYPQVEIQPPPIEETEEGEDLDAQAMVEAGREIFQGKGTCYLCHKIGESSESPPFPDLGDIGARAGSRIEGMDDVVYLAQSLYEPNAYVVEGFAPSMLAADQPPINLTDREILTVIAYLQSLGGTPSVTMATELPTFGSTPIVAETPAAAESPTAPAPAETAAAEDTTSEVVEAPPTAEVAATPPPAQTSAAADSGADVENGEKLYFQSCVACHGADARGNPALNSPRLDVQEAWYIARQLKNFSIGARGSDPRDLYGMQMRTMTLTLTDQDMADLAAYLESISPP